MPPGLLLACALAVEVGVPDAVHAARSPAAISVVQAAAIGRAAKFRRRMEPTVGIRHGNPLCPMCANPEPILIISQTSPQVRMPGAARTLGAASQVMSGTG